MSGLELFVVGVAMSGGMTRAVTNWSQLIYEMAKICQHQSILRVLHGFPIFIASHRRFMPQSIKPVRARPFRRNRKSSFLTDISIRAFLASHTTRKNSCRFTLLVIPGIRKKQVVGKLTVPQNSHVYLLSCLFESCFECCLIVFAAKQTEVINSALLGRVECKPSTISVMDTLEVF